MIIKNFIKIVILIGLLSGCMYSQNNNTPTPIKREYIDCSPNCHYQHKQWIDWQGQRTRFILRTNISRSERKYLRKHSNKH